MPKLRQWSTKRRALVAAATVIVLAVAGAGAWAATRPQPAPQQRAIAARTTTLRQTLTTSGTIEPAQQSNLNFGASGQVTAVDVAVGQQVTQGQALATVSSASLAASVAEAKSALAADQAKLTSDQNANAAAAQVAADQAAVTAAQNQLNTANTALAGATLTAPITGTVAEVNLTVGQQVAAGGSSSGSTASGSAASGAAGSSGGSGRSGSSQSGSSQSGSGQSGGGQSAGGATGSAQDSSGSSSASSTSAQIVVISAGSYVVNATVDDTQVGHVKPGNAVQITPNGATDPVPGTVSTVGMLSKSSSSVPSYPVTISISGSPPGLFAGAGAQVAIVVKEITDAVVVPAVAVHYANGAAYVEQSNGGQSVRHPVNTGMTEGGQIQITSGLSAGDAVLVPASAAGTRGAGAGGTGSGAGQGGGRGGFGGLGGGFGGGGGGGRGGNGGAGTGGGTSSGRTAGGGG